MAGVSPSTVSRAFVAPNKVKSVTLERIKSVAKELDYQPNPVAQSLITGKMMTIGLLIPDIENPVFAGMVKGVGAVAKAAGYQVLLADTNENPDEELAAANRLATQTDGLILASSRLPEEQIVSIAASSPVVLVNRRASGVSSCVVDYRGGIMQAMRHLQALGHKKIAYLSGPSLSMTEGERRKAMVDFCVENGVELSVLGPFEPTFDGGEDAADDLMGYEASAVFAYNDVMAIGLMYRLETYGVKVPDELSVVGFDDIDFAKMASPSLSTVQTDASKMGTNAAKRLIATIQTDKEPPPPSEELLRTRLILRASTKPFVASSN